MTETMKRSALLHCMMPTVTGLEAYWQLNTFQQLPTGIQEAALSSVNTNLEDDSAKLLQIKIAD